MNINPYLFFEGRAEEAMAYYESAIGAERGMVMRFSESPDPVPEEALPPGGGRAIMHAEMTVGDGRIMLTDGCGPEKQNFQGFSLTLSVKDAAEAERLFSALSEGGEIRMPFGKTFFSPGFGMLADRFGVPWTIVAEA